MDPAIHTCLPSLPRVVPPATTDGEVRQIESALSDALTTIGGYAVVWHHRAYLVLSSALSPDQQALGRLSLTQRINELPLRAGQIVLWHPDD